MLLTVLPFVVFILNGLRIISGQRPQPWTYYLISSVVYLVSRYVQDHLFMSPIPDNTCVKSNHPLIFGISSYGFPDAGLCYMISILTCRIVLSWSKTSATIQHVTHTIAVCLLLYAYYYTNHLWWWQILCTFIWAVVFTLTLIFIYRSVLWCWVHEDGHTPIERHKKKSSAPYRFEDDFMHPEYNTKRV
jgi:hypothetical protein